MKLLPEIVCMRTYVPQQDAADAALEMAKITMQNPYPISPPPAAAAAQCRTGVSHTTPKTPAAALTVSAHNTSRHQVLLLAAGSACN
jgi:hypothetical protein